MGELNGNWDWDFKAELEAMNYSMTITSDKTEGDDILVNLTKELDGVYPLYTSSPGEDYSPLSLPHGVYTKIPKVGSDPECLLQLDWFGEKEKLVACQLKACNSAYMSRYDYYQSTERDFILESYLYQNFKFTVVRAHAWVHKELLNDHKVWFISTDKCSSTTHFGRTFLDVSSYVRPEMLEPLIRFLYRERVELTAAEYLYLRHLYLKELDIWPTDYVQEPLVPNIPIPAETNDEKNRK